MPLKRNNNQMLKETRKNEKANFITFIGTIYRVIPKKRKSAHGKFPIHYTSFVPIFVTDRD
jgi:hypothetical protein